MFAKTVPLAALCCLSSIATAQAQTTVPAAPVKEASPARAAAVAKTKPAEKKAAAPAKKAAPVALAKKAAATPTPSAASAKSAKAVPPGNKAKSAESSGGKVAVPAAIAAPGAAKEPKAAAKPGITKVSPASPIVLAPSPETKGSSLAGPAVDLPGAKKQKPARGNKPKSGKKTAPSSSSLAGAEKNSLLDSPTELPPRNLVWPMVNAWMGVGTTLIGATGFDAFSEDDALTGFALGVGYSPEGLLPAGFSFQAGWETASTAADYRGEKTGLSTSRFSLGGEVRAQLLDRVDYYLRFAGTALQVQAEIEESSTGATLSDKLWTFGVDATVGLQVHLLHVPTRNSRDVNLFARVEGGYLWFAEKDVSLGGTSDDAPVRLEAIKMPSLDMGGDQFRFALGINY